MRDATWWSWCLVVILACQCLMCLCARPPINMEVTVGSPMPAPTTKEPCKDAGRLVNQNKGKGLNLVVETYIVEHEISEKSARKSAREIDPDELSSYAIKCKGCTSNDMEYCSGSAIIHDHCCCDGRFTEIFPFVPHTCYRGPEMCRPVKNDCEEYEYIRDCCCRIHLAAKWKGRYVGNDATFTIDKMNFCKWLWMLPWIITLILA